MSFLRTYIVFAAMMLLAVGPIRANSLHGEKGASNNGTTDDADFKALNGGPDIDGIATTVYFNTNSGDVLDVFTLPSSFTAGTPVTLTFNTSSGVYGIFDCDNGSNSFAIGVPTFPSTIPPVLNGPCTAGPAGSNDKFVSFVDGTTSATLTFLGGAGAPSTVVLYANDGTLTGITSGSGTAVPEPGTLLLVGIGLGGLFLLRRRTETPGSNRGLIAA
jgi:hypothetical protein